MMKMIEYKQVYTTQDFEGLNWHDCKIHGLAFDDKAYKFYLDIDLIIEWINPQEKNECYKFKIAPATLVFKNVWNLVFDIDTNLTLSIDGVSMLNPHLPKNKDYVPDEMEYDWLITLLEGEISFKSIGFEIYIRKSPEIGQKQTLGLDERGGISFSTKVETD
jgi:hypothetical protein